MLFERTLLGWQCWCLVSLVSSCGSCTLTMRTWVRAESRVWSRSFSDGRALLHHTGGDSDTEILRGMMPWSTSCSRVLLCWSLSWSTVKRKGPPLEFLSERRRQRSKPRRGHECAVLNTFYFTTEWGYYLAPSNLSREKSICGFCLFGELGSSLSLYLFT